MRCALAVFSHWNNTFGCYNLVFGPLRILILWKFITPLRQYRTIKSSQNIHANDSYITPHTHTHIRHEGLPQARKAKLIRNNRRLLNLTFNHSEKLELSSHFKHSTTAFLRCEIWPVFRFNAAWNNNDLITFILEKAWADGRVKLISQNECLWFFVCLVSVRVCVSCQCHWHTDMIN